MSVKTTSTWSLFLHIGRELYLEHVRIVRRHDFHLVAGLKPTLVELILQKRDAQRSGAPHLPEFRYAPITLPVDSKV